MSQSYAGIGSRKTPANIIALMEQLAYILARKGHTLRSGGAEGADTAFEYGCTAAGGTMEIYLPWRGFNNRKSPLHSPSTEAYDLAAQFHPNWEACSAAAMNLHARNCHQVLGLHLNDPVTSVICWTPRASGSGGTGQAIRIARHYDIEILDLADPAVAGKAHHFVKDHS